MFKFLQLKIVLLVCVLLVTSCASPSPLAGTPVTEEEFDAAVQQAHDTLDTLHKGMSIPRWRYSFVGLKVRFIGEEESEDMWTEPVAYSNGVFTVYMIEGLTIDRGLHAGDYVMVPLERVLDWMLVEKDGNLIGGYTIRLDYAHMTPKEQKEFIKVTGYRIK